jgi:hypothetical protein
MCWCWASTPKSSSASHGPSSSGGGSEVDFVCLESTSAAIDNNPGKCQFFESNCSSWTSYLCSSTLSVSALPWPVTGHGW